MEAYAPARENFCKTTNASKIEYLYNAIWPKIEKINMMIFMWLTVIN